MGVPIFPEFSRMLPNSVMVNQISVSGQSKVSYENGNDGMLCSMTESMISANAETVTEMVEPNFVHKPFRAIVEFHLCSFSASIVPVI